MRFVVEWSTDSADKIPDECQIILSWQMYKNSDKNSFLG